MAKKTRIKRGVRKAADRKKRRSNESQGNRNPFIDHPEWAKGIFGARCS